MTNITIPKGVTYINDYTFQNCQSLRSVDLSNVTEIGTYAFTMCCSLKTIKADKLTTARNIQLTGDVTGSASFDGSQDIQINCTVAGGTGGGGASSEELQALTGRVNTLEGTVNTINDTEIPGIKSRLSTLEANNTVHEIGSTVPQTLAAGHIYFQIPAE